VVWYPARRQERRHFECHRQHAGGDAAFSSAAYVDQFKSPARRWHFDVVNIKPTGFPGHGIILPA
jgi:hypothetical protein